MIWLAFALLVGAALIVVLPPLMGASRVSTRAERDLAVYRDQLREVDRDQERGLISTAEADAARTEIKRRILALAPAPSTPQTSTAPMSKLATAAIAVAIAGASFAIYLALGQPGLPARPYDAALEQQVDAQDMLQQVDAMVAKLAARLKTTPNDVKGWRMLGWSYLQLGRADEAVSALTRAVALDGENGPLRSQLGEALVRQANGTVTPQALAAFDEALQRDAKDPSARFYKGLALTQAGKDREALEAWAALLRDGPRDAEWFLAVQSQARDLAVKLKLDPKTVLP